MLTRSAATRVVQELMTASAALNESVRVVQSDASDDAFQQYRARVAEVLATIYLDLVKPIVRDFPELDPGQDTLSNE